MQKEIDDKTNTEVRQIEFEANQIRFLSSNIEFLRNRFVYDKLDYSNVDEIEFKTGYLLKNRWIIRLIALTVVILLIRFIQYGLFHTENLQETNLSFWFNRGAIISVWGPIILVIGAFLVFYQSFKKSTVITIKTSKYKRSISILELDKKGQINQLISFLKSKNVLVFDKRNGV
jgi:hypothetical protein